ncbi:MAG: SCO family protein [Magnetococcales bacterium]|nr:SCO family protein [Magnetococcales bacterium]
MNTIRPRFMQIQRFWRISLLPLLLITFIATLHAETPNPLSLTGGFSLMDDQGKSKHLEDYRGSFLLVFFGYTYCPDICPTNLGIMAQALNKLPPTVSQRLIPLFISVDPERDTIKQLREYIQTFHPRLTGLTGTSAQLRQAANSFGVYFARVETNPPNPKHYLIDHSAGTYFIDDQGRLLEIFEHQMPPETMAQRILQRMQP